MSSFKPSGRQIDYGDHARDTFQENNDSRLEIGITGNHELSFDPSLRGLEHELSATMGRCGHTGNCDCLGPDDHDNEGDDLDDDGMDDD